MIMQSGGNMKKHFLFFAFIMIIAIAFTACASTKQLENTDNQQESSQALDEIRDHGFLEGTVWKAPIKIMDFDAFQRLEIKNGQAWFATEMGNAVDGGDVPERIELRGNTIRFISADGGGIGTLDEDTIIMKHDGLIYTRVK